jgi:hypothetical protein
MTTTKTIKITLGHHHFDVPQFNLRQHIAIAALSPSDPVKRIGEILKIALSRAEPLVSAEDLMEFETDFAEVVRAVTAVMRNGGYEVGQASTEG